MNAEQVEDPGSAPRIEHRVPVRATLLAAGVVLSTATQWRVGGGPIGLGELLLAAWLAMTSVAVLSRGRVTLTPITRMVLVFWGLASVLLLAGWLMSLWLGVWNADRTYHDLFALSFAALLSIFLVVQPNAGRETETASRLLVLFAAGAMVLLYLSRLGLFSIPFTNPSFGEVRFTGWSTNPNQFAILSLVVPFIAVRLGRRATGRGPRLLYLAAGALALFVGVATGSEALLLSWLFCGSLLLIVVLVRWAISSPKGYWGAYVAYVLVPCVVIGLVVTALAPLTGFAWDVAASVYDAQEAQGSVRLSLWRNGLMAMGSSPLFGLGPGAYSGIAGPFLEREAHNTFIDWGMSTGIAGVLAFGAVAARVLRRAGGRRDLVAFAGVTNLLLFSLFHYVLRHPVFWFYLILAAGDEPPLRRDPPAGARVRHGTSRTRAPVPGSATSLA